MATITTKPLVSVILCTYNQARYIRKAVRSILFQKVDFDYEVIVADDCSDDSTLLIVRAELSQAPNVTILPSVQNCGISANYRRAFAACRGDYISVLEGDDFWSSPNKLQDQVDILRENLDCSIAISQTCVFFQDLGRCSIHPQANNSSRMSRFRIEDLILTNFTNFSGATYRGELVREIPPRMFEIKAYDWLLHMWMAQFGMIGCVNSVQIVYRVHSAGLWSGLTHESKLKAQLDVLEEYDEFLDFRYSSEFAQVRKGLEEALGLSRLEVAAVDNDDPMMDAHMGLPAFRPKLRHKMLFPLAKAAKLLLPALLLQAVKPVWLKIR